MKENRGGYIFKHMRQKHHNWFVRIFSYPTVVEDLLRSFVHEDFVKELDFKSLKKLDPNFFPASESSRHADVIYEISSHGQPTFIYLFFEFQSTVDWFMPLRMARYMFEFYDELRRNRKLRFFNPPFCILIYNGDPGWYAPERFSELLYKSSIPKEYIPEFRYFKIAINEIPIRDLVKLRNAASAVFYIENNGPMEINENWDELVSILKEVINKAWGKEIIQEIVNRLFQLYQIPENSKFIASIDGLGEVKNMLETRAKEWEKKVLEKGFEKGSEEGLEKGIRKGIEKVALNMITNGESDEKITLYTGLSLKQITEIRGRGKKASEDQEC